MNLVSLSFAAVLLVGGSALQADRHIVNLVDDREARSSFERVLGPGEAIRVYSSQPVAAYEISEDFVFEHRGCRFPIEAGAIGVDTSVRMITRACFRSAPLEERPAAVCLDDRDSDGRFDRAIASYLNEPTRVPYAIQERFSRRLRLASPIAYQALDGDILPDIERWFQFVGHRQREDGKLQVELRGITIIEGDEKDYENDRDAFHVARPDVGPNFGSPAGLAFSRDEMPVRFDFLFYEVEFLELNSDGSARIRFTITD